MKEGEKKGKIKKSFFNNEGSNSQGTWTTATQNDPNRNKLLNEANHSHDFKNTPISLNTQIKMAS